MAHAHGGCACHASLPRHRFHSTQPPPPAIYPRVVPSNDDRSALILDSPVHASSAAPQVGTVNSCSQSADVTVGTRISAANESFLTIIPAGLEEACFQVPAPGLGASLTERMRAVLCSSSSAPLYCTPARNGGTVYWIAHTLSPVCPLSSQVVVLVIHFLM